MISSTQTSFIIESESGCGLRNHFSQAVRTVVFWKICIGLFVCDFSKNLLGRHVELLAASFVGGLVWAGSIAMSSAILADTYGVRLVGVLYGLAYLGHQFGATFSSWLGGWGYETFGTHWVAFGMSGGLLIVVALVSMTLPKNAVRG